jgi:adenylate kinase
MQHQVVILIGPPGAGKGTQADLLSEDFGFYHLDTSKIVEKKMHEDASDPALQKAQADFKAGKLVDPKLVASWVVDTIREIGATGSMVFSGSFRTNLEADVETPIVEEIFGKDNVHVVNIQVSEEESVKRNVARRVCKANRHPIPNFPEFETITMCPKDGSELIKRILDNEETMRVRYATYLQETAPVLDYFRNRGYTIVEINGEQKIREVHNDIMTGLHSLAHPDLEKKLNDSIGSTN